MRSYKREQYYYFQFSFNRDLLRDSDLVVWMQERGIGTFQFSFNRDLLRENDTHPFYKGTTGKWSFNSLLIEIFLEMRDLGYKLDCNQIRDFQFSFNRDLLRVFIEIALPNQDPNRIFQFSFNRDLLRELLKSVKAFSLASELPFQFSFNRDLLRG